MCGVCVCVCVCVGGGHGEGDNFGIRKALIDWTYIYIILCCAKEDNRL